MVEAEALRFLPGEIAIALGNRIRDDSTTGSRGFPVDRPAIVAAK
ncbi:hypothetical protein V0288_00800 [Pannus brasiliensis CCIBt3594]|uniref:Uncharacterized protein n=1 Tax=Pannus brasiliensis CCIBt3594 TaxID=1427578 RepID=A0AAW9QSY9_9CHRO